MKGGCSPQNSVPLRYLSGELQMENSYTAIHGSSRGRIFQFTRSRGNSEQARESQMRTDTLGLTPKSSLPE